MRRHFSSSAVDILYSKNTRTALISERLLDHVANPRNCGPLEGATHYGQDGVPGDGPYVQLWLAVEDGKVTKAAYKTYGCPAAIASASFTAEFVHGRDLELVKKLEAKDLATLIGELPEGKGDCPQRVFNALKSAIGEA